LQSVRVIADKDGFRLLLSYGSAEHLLESAKGHVHIFRALDSIASYLGDLGLFDFRVNINNWHSQTHSNGETEK
jgi:hypothetical protein